MESQRYQNMFGTEVLSGSGHIFGPSLGIISGSVSCISKDKDRSLTWLLSDVTEDPQHSTTFLVKTQL